MNAEENMKILSKILEAIQNNNLDDVMIELGYEVQCSTEKRKEYTLK